MVESHSQSISGSGLWPTDLNALLVSPLVVLRWQSWIAAIFTFACIGCFALTVILGKLNTLWVGLDFRWLTRPVESITLFGLPCCGCVLRIVLLPMTHCSRSSDAFLWIWALSPSAMTSPPQFLTDEVCLGLWAGSIFSHFDLSITLAQVDLCLVCPKHFDPNFCSFPGALDANCNLAFSEGCILWRTCWGYTGVVLSWRLSLTHYTPTLWRVFLICWTALRELSFKLLWFFCHPPHWSFLIQ